MSQYLKSLVRLHLSPCIHQTGCLHRKIQAVFVTVEVFAIVTIRRKEPEGEKLSVSGVAATREA